MLAFVFSLPVQSRFPRSWVLFFPLLLFPSFCLQSQMVHVLSLFFQLSSIGFVAKETAVQLSVYKGDCPKLLYRLM